MLVYGKKDCRCCTAKEFAVITQNKESLNKKTSLEKLEFLKFLDSHMLFYINGQT